MPDAESVGEASWPPPDAVCDGGELDCGSGLLLIIRSAMQPLPPGGVLEVRSREPSVREDLPAWCRLVGHTLVGDAPGLEPRATHYRIRKKVVDEALARDLETARRFTWQARVRWTEGMQARAYVRNHSFLIGQPASFDTTDAAPAAVELLLAALAGCLAVGFQWRASQRGITIEQLEVSLQARADNILVFLGVEDTGHAGLAEVTGRLFVETDADPALLEPLWQETLHRSPLARSLESRVALAIELRRT